MNFAVILLACACCAALSGRAASIEATVKDGKGAVLEDAVVFAVPKSGPAPRPRRDAAIEQINKTFVPMVTVVQAGTPVRFPNRDEIRHHVYSFSPTKVFEIKLYAGTPVDPVLFDKTGEVVLGCNIHDHMIAYMIVVDTPYYAKSGKDGLARIEGMPAGEYDLNVWHYAQAAKADAAVLRLRADEAATLALAIPLRVMPPRPVAK